MCQTDALLCVTRVRLSKKELNFYISRENNMCHADAHYVSHECAICVIRVHFKANQKSKLKISDSYVSDGCAFMCHTDAPKNGERTTIRPKKEFSTCSPYLKIKYIKKETLIIIKLKSYCFYNLSNVDIVVLKYIFLDSYTNKF